jgi:hypothetical protein
VSIDASLVMDFEKLSLTTTYKIQQQQTFKIDIFLENGGILFTF